MDSNEVFSRNLKFFVIRSGKTQSQIAADIGVSKGTFSDWCSGRSHPRMDKVQYLAEYFGVNKSDLIEDGTKETDIAKFVAMIQSRPVLKRMLFAVADVDDDSLELIVNLIEKMGRKK